MFFFEETKMNYITTSKQAFLAQGVQRKKHLKTKNKGMKNIYKSKAKPPKGNLKKEKTTSLCQE
jgi:hypothetical protein